MSRMLLFGVEGQLPQTINCFWADFHILSRFLCWLIPAGCSAMSFLAAQTIDRRVDHELGEMNFVLDSQRFFFDR